MLSWVILQHVSLALDVPLQELNLAISEFIAQSLTNIAGSPPPLSTIQLSEALNSGYANTANASHQCARQYDTAQGEVRDDNRICLPCLNADHS